MIYFDNFEVKHITKIIVKFIGKKKIHVSLFLFILCSMDESVTDFKNLFSPHNFRKNDQRNLDFFKSKV